MKKESKDKGKGNVTANSGTKGLKALDIPEGISTEELIVIQRCIHYFELTLEDGLDSEEETRIKYEKAKQDLQKVKQKFGRTEDYFSENVLRANYVIRNLKSPKYIADKKKRIGRLKFLYYGIDDPFYDGLKEIYGDEGLEGYSKERLKAFNDISDDVELAHQRYSKVYNVFTHIRTLIQLAGWIASWFVLYPSCAAAGCNPLIFGAGMAILSQGIKYLEIDRESTNYEIFAARVRVAKELGFIDKNKIWGGR